MLVDTYGLHMSGAICTRIPNQDSKNPVDYQIYLILDCCLCECIWDAIHGDMRSLLIINGRFEEHLFRRRCGRTCNVVLCVPACDCSPFYLAIPFLFEKHVRLQEWVLFILGQLVPVHWGTDIPHVQLIHLSSCHLVGITYSTLDAHHEI